MAGPIAAQTRTSGIGTGGSRYGVTDALRQPARVHATGKQPPSGSHVFEELWQGLKLRLGQAAAAPQPVTASTVGKKRRLETKRRGEGSILCLV